MTSPILLIEDSDEDADQAIRALVKLATGRPVIRARDGDEAAGILFMQRVTPVLILLGLGVPEIDGCILLNMIRAERPLDDVPVCVLTMDDSEHTKAMCIKAGADGYVTKPVTGVGFAHAVAKLHKRHDASGEMRALQDEIRGRMRTMRRPKKR